MSSNSPKVFISYSWTSPGFQATIKQWAERLLADGIDVVLDIYDLKEGQDKYVFMERMVTDPSVTHVLVMSDKTYAEKADARKAGVGTESQIISSEVYAKVEQSKFIPIICELDEKGERYLPAFFKSRIWIDFSTPEAVNENWEQLIRVLYGKPLHVKPKVGNPPAYLREDSAPASPVISKYSTLKQALLTGKPAIEVYRRDFFDACIQFADALRIRKRPEVDNFGQQVVADCGKLKTLRDHIIDWVLLESTISPVDKFHASLISFLERLLEVKAKPNELTTWNNSWFDAHSVFVYETFLYIIAALLKTGAYEVLHEIFTSQYMQPVGSYEYNRGELSSFACFWTNSDALQVLAPEGQTLYFPPAELIKRQADRSDIPFESVMEADLLILLMAFILPNVRRWYPGTLHYSQHRPFPFFVRATHHKGFHKLSIITGIIDVQQLRDSVLKGHDRLGANRWQNFYWSDMVFSELMNLNKLDTIK